MSISVQAASGFRSNPLLRAALAMPLLYVILHQLPGRWEWVFPGGQAPDFYLITGLLFGIPLAVWGLALALLVIGSVNRVLWGVVCVGGFAITAYGLLFVFEVELRFNPGVAFGLYAALLGLSQLFSPRAGGRFASRM